MQFLCEVRGQQHLVRADRVGGYTMVYFAPADNLEAIVTYQLFPAVIDETSAPDSAVFLERVTRIALAHFEHAATPFPLISVIAYTSALPTYMGEIVTISSNSASNNDTARRTALRPCAPEAASPDSGQVS